MWAHWGSEQQEELTYQVTYLAVEGDYQTHQALNAKLVEQYAKLGFTILKFFAICQLRHAHVRKDTRLSLLFRTASNEKLGGAWEQGKCARGKVCACGRWERV